MDNFLSLPPTERSKYFSVAADRMGLATHLIEKDFWVCWILQLLFTMPEIKEHLTFKGGTSLSKVFGIIKRFSEDIDLSIEKSFFGFTGEKDPEQATSKKRKKLLEELGVHCRDYVQGEVQSRLSSAIGERISASESWSLTVDQNDRDGQTLLFRYPGEEKATPEYIQPVVKIEFGARGEHWPVIQHTVRTYLEEMIPDALTSKIEIQVLAIERTFWEKATILHMFAHFPDGKAIPVRQSRHYYDFYTLIESEYFDEAKSNTELLKRVADYKSIYFRVAWARYDLAQPTSLKLVPEDRVLKEMESDYKKMEQMFFESPPSWDLIIEKIRSFQDEFNSQAGETGEAGYQSKMR